ncbi:MAG: hypothetical protein KAT90_01180 [Gammaproteobacteria bacterium]|nr:hypothetical protein [Gammaproteobacteria bacterium]
MFFIAPYRVDKLFEGGIFILLPRLNIIHLIILLSISIFTETAFASQQTKMVTDPVLDGEENKTIFTPPHLTKENGMIMLDYEVIPVAGNQSIDLLGVHYLQQFNNWLYLGLGVHAPLVHGNYGGFMTVDGTIHAQRKVFGDLFIDAGASFGGGGGGSSIQQSKELSGTGGFIKSYLGFGYEFNEFSAGVNYANFRFKHSQINHSQLNFYIQKRFSFSNASYASSGSKIKSDYTFSEGGGNILTLEANNIFQKNPEGLNKETINSLSLQFSHFLTRNRYLFFSADIGYKGLPMYNQALGGIGYKFSVSSRTNLYSQIGVGSGGYSPDQIDTGSGLLVYPKVSAEYILSNNLGLYLSSGYLVAPKGSSKNVTLGAGINYHFSGKHNNRGTFGAAKYSMYRGLRVNVFPQTEFNVQIKNSEHDNINLLSTQFDYLVNDNWYVPIQISVAYNEFKGYPGYGEVFIGSGVQSKFSTKSSFQNFLQILIGANVEGVLLKPSVGINYSLSDKLAFYGQFGKTMSINKSNLYPNDKRFSAYSVGLGLTYRFSLL